MRIVGEPNLIAAGAVVWPENFPQDTEVVCPACGLEIALNSPRDFTVKHQPLRPDEERHIPRLPNGDHVDGDVPFDPDGDRWIVAYECPGCGDEQIVKV